uniref:Integrase catalytic domain-containing protein n=1 Tax=Nicotiana tabacum TaxID=4097 RepID=A0A1S4B9B0_TOBAC|nr:PREDICTED: uncharacterized protein LOC107805818 [Nicotiana tabacum]
MAEDSELWDVICDGPYVPTKKVGDPTVTMPKTRKEYDDANRKAVEKNFRAKKILVCGIGPDEYNRISACQSAKEIWEALETTHEGTTQVKQSKIDMLTTEYELFRIKHDESIQDMRTRFTSIINELHSLAWGDPSSESEEETDAGDSSMMEVESDENEYDSIFALMAQSDNDEVNFREVQRNLKSYSPKKLMSFKNVFIDAYHSLLDDKDALTIELGDAEQTRDDLVVLTEKIASVEHERDDLVVVAVDLKETIENFSKEKDALVEKGIAIEQERDDLLVVILDLWETIKELEVECRPGNFEKGKEGAMKGSSQQWFMDSGCSKHMTRNTMDFLLLKALQGGSVFFGNGKRGTFLVGDLSCLKFVDDDAELWHRRLGHASFPFLNKLIQQDLVCSLPMSKFKEHKVCDAYAKGKHVKSSFKSKKDVITSKPLDHLHMDLCGPMRVQRWGGKKYIFVVVDDYSRFTSTLFLRTKDETFEVFIELVKKIQVKMESRVACIRSDHGTEFDNAKFDEFCNENDITHNFSAPITPQQNGVMEGRTEPLRKWEEQC